MADRRRRRRLWGRFAPPAISGLQLWLAADRITGLADADPVGTWADLSGKGNDATQATAAKKPTYKVNILNGRPVVRFDGTDDFLRATFTLNQPFTRISVFSKIVWASGKQVFGGVSGNVGALYMQTATPRLTMFAGLDGPTTTALADDTFGVLAEIYDGASSELYVNGGTAITGDPSTGNPGGVTVCGSNTGVNDPRVDMAEVVVYNRALSTAERQQVEQYLGVKYAITVA